MAGNKALYEGALEKGHSYAWEGDWQRAAEEYRRAASEFPQDPLAHRAMGWTLFQVGRLREALTAYRQVLELLPKDLATQRRLVEIYLGLGRTREAQDSLLSLADLHQEGGEQAAFLEALQEAVRLDPNNLGALQRLAQAYISQGDLRSGAARYVSLSRLLQEDGELDKALELVRQAIQLDRENEEARQLLLSLSQAQATVSPEEIVTIEGSPGPATQGQALVQTRIMELIRQEEASWQGAPGEKLPEVMVLRKALDLQHQGKWAEALAQYDEAVDGTLAREEIDLARGFLYAKIGECSQAQALLHSFADSRYAPAINHALGDCYLGRSGPQEALPYLLGSLQLLELAAASPAQMPYLRQAYEQLRKEHLEVRGGRAMRRIAYRLASLLGSGDWETGIAEMRRRLDALAPTGMAIPIAEVLELPRDEAFMDAVGRILEAMEKQQYFTALEQTYRSLESWSEFLPLHALTGEILAQGGRVREAVEKYVSLANAYEVRGDHKRARAAYSRAMALAPQEPGIQRRLLDLLVAQGLIEEALEWYLNLGNTYQQLGQSDDAIRAYREGLDLVSSTDQSREWRAKILHRLADLQNQLGAWRDALSLYTEVKQLLPQEDGARRALVQLQLQLGSTSAALKELEELLAIYREGEELGKAVEVLQGLLSAHSAPDDLGLAVHEYLGQAYLELGMKERAITVFDALGAMQLDAGFQDKARMTIERIIALQPENVEEYRSLLKQLSGNADSESQ